MSRFDESDLEPELARRASEYERRDVISKLRLLERNLVSKEELYYNLLIRLVDSHSSCWGEMLDAIPPETLSLFGDYAQRELEASDFVLSPEVFVVDRGDMKSLDAVSAELRPRYARLLELIRTKISAVNMYNDKKTQ